MTPKLAIALALVTVVSVSGTPGKQKRISTVWENSRFGGDITYPQTTSIQEPHLNTTDGGTTTTNTSTNTTTVSTINAAADLTTNATTSATTDSTTNTTTNETIDSTTNATTNIKNNATHVLLEELDFARISRIPDRVFNRFGTVTLNCPNTDDVAYTSTLLRSLSLVNAIRLGNWQSDVVYWLRLAPAQNATSCALWAAEANKQYFNLFQGILTTSTQLLYRTLSIFPQNPKQTECRDEWKDLQNILETVHSHHLKFGFLSNPEMCSKWKALVPDKVLEKFDALFYNPDTLQQKSFWAHTPSYLQKFKLSAILNLERISRKFPNCRKMMVDEEENEELIWAQNYSAIF